MPTPSRVTYRSRDGHTIIVDGFYDPSPSVDVPLPPASKLFQHSIETSLGPIVEYRSMIGRSDSVTMLPEDIRRPFIDYAPFPDRSYPNLAPQQVQLSTKLAPYSGSLAPLQNFANYTDDPNHNGGLT